MLSNKITSCFHFYLPNQMKLKILSLVIFFFTWCVCSFATAVKFTGKVIDGQTQSGLPGATVTIPDLRISVVTDDKGEFKFTHITRKGRVLVEVTFIGYQTHTQIIDLGTVNTFDFALSPTTIEAKEVVVTGTAFSAANKKNSASVAIVSHEELTNKPANNIIDALVHVPGVSQITTGNAVSKPVIRGLSFNRIVTISNGLKQEGNQFGDEHGIEIDQFSAGQVEIIRGPASLLYGSDALGGVINIINPIPIPDEEGRMHGEFLSNYSLNNGLFANSLMFYENQNGFVYRARGTIKNAHSFKTPTGYFPNSGYKELDFDGQAGVNKAWGYVTLDFSGYRNQLGLYDGRLANSDGTYQDQNNNVLNDENFKSYALAYPQQDVRHYKLALNSNIIVAKGRLKSTFGYQGNTRREIGAPKSSPELFLDLATYSYDMKYYAQEKNGWEPAFGVAGQFQNADNTSEKAINTILPSYHSTSIGVFAYIKKSWVNTTVNGGIRWDNRSLDGSEFINKFGALKYAAFNNSESSFSGALGLTHEFDKKLNFKMNAGTAFRMPNIAELASEGVHAGTMRYEIGNPNLKPEQSYQVDASLSYDAELWNVSLGGFVNYINNYIFSSNNSTEPLMPVIVGTEEKTYAIYRSIQADALLCGSEASLMLHPLKYLHFENTFSYTYGLNKSSNKPLSLIPAATLRSELKFEASIKGLKKSYISIGVDNFFNQNSVDDLFETPTAGYSLVNMGIGTTIPLKRQQLTIYISAKNLLNTKYYDALSRLKPGRFDISRTSLGVYNPGTNITFGIFMPLSIKRW